MRRSIHPMIYILLAALALSGCGPKPRSRVASGEEACALATAGLDSLLAANPKTRPILLRPHTRPPRWWGPSIDLRRCPAVAQRLAAPGLGFKKGFGEDPEIPTFSLTTPMLLPDGHRAGMVFEAWRHGSGWTVTADRRDGRWIVVDAFGWAT